MKSSVRTKLAAVSGAFALLVTLLPMAGTAAANHGERTLKLSPQKLNNRLGTTHRVIATLSSAPDEGSPIHIDFEITGVNDPDGGESPETPDLTCTVTGIDDPATERIDESRECRSPSYGGPGESIHEGVDEIRGWIDHDGTDAVVEADRTEGADETLEPGDTPEPDGTDVVLTRWFQGLPRAAGLDCSPEQSVLPVTGPDSSLSVDCVLVDKAPRPDGPLAGWIVDGENLGGANDPDDGADDNLADYNDLCTTDAAGQCSFTIAAADGEAGLAGLCFWVDEDEDASYHATPPWDGAECVEAADAPENDNQTDVITVEWRRPAPPVALRTLTLTSSKDTATFGRPFTLSGRVQSQAQSCAGGVAIELQRRGSGAEDAFKTIAAGTTAGDGSYSFTRTANGSADYRTIAGTDTECEDASSGAATVETRKKVTLKAARNPVRKGRKIELRVEVLGCEAREDKVVLYKRKNGKLKKLAAMSTNDNCKSVFRRRVWRKTVFQARSPQTRPDFLGGASRLVRVRIK